MLDLSLKNQIKTLFSNLKNRYTFSIKAAPNHASYRQLIDLLSQVAECSDMLSIKIADGEGLSFSVLKNDKPSNIQFRFVPTGHEFTTLLLLILNQEGIGKNMPDPLLVNRISSLTAKLELKSYISLTCTNCPEVIQAINILAILNSNISHQIIDGSINQDEVNALNIQAVPTVYANGKLLHVGRSTLGELLSKLEEITETKIIADNIDARHYDVVVAGGGPAGISAAIYSVRKGLSVALIAEKIGGQVTQTSAIENMISWPRTTGAELTNQFGLHLANYPVDIFENRTIQMVDMEGGLKKIQTSIGETLITPSLIIATGASWRKLNVPGESRFIGSGVAFCTHCDAPFYKDKEVVVVGSGNSGLEAAIDLSAVARHVTILECLDKIKGDQVLQTAISKLSNVKIIKNVEILSIEGENKVSHINYRDQSTGQITGLNTDGVFVQIGLKANSQPFVHLLESNRIGEIIVDASCRTSVPGIYAAGDVTTTPYKQIVIALGEGAKAAISAYEDRIREKQQ